MSHLSQFIQHCNDSLLIDKDNEVNNALKYLYNVRHIKPETVVTHKIGYCHKEKNIPEEICFFGKESGDILNGKGYSYFIQGRIIVPVYDEFGKVVGFATRKPTSEQGETWWNLAKPFYKSHHLFLLDKSRKEVFENNKIYLVEGYMDAIILKQEGLKGIVSIMGTKLSSRQVGLIARYCDNVCICLDVDENQAGQMAQDKIIYILRKFNFCDSISIIENLPQGEDPDIFVAKNGLPTFLAQERKLTSDETQQIYERVAIACKGR